jgi:hypothetical protein
MPAFRFAQTAFSEGSADGYLEVVFPEVIFGDEKSVSQD